mmetsp:Transcript_22446/g.64163  ORF Transcript_22446/g.64163 Transcript_22446/m.64163 type:complete len:126 (-) Transcript_22446:1019-1396(-)
MNAFVESIAAWKKRPPSHPPNHSTCAVDAMHRRRPDQQTDRSTDKTGAPPHARTHASTHTYNYYVHKHAYTHARSHKDTDRHIDKRTYRERERDIVKPYRLTVANKNRSHSATKIRATNAASQQH